MTSEAERPHHHLTILLTILGLTVLVAGALMYLNYSLKQSTIPEPVATVTPEPFVFTKLPEALDNITIPDQGDTTGYDADAYKTAVTEVGLVTSPIASPLDFEYQGQPFSTYLEANPDVANDFNQIMTELRAVAQHLNEQFSPPPLRIRQPDLIPAGAPDVTFVDPTQTEGIYPFMPAIEAELVTASMISHDADNEPLYQKQLDDYFSTLLASGYLGKSDLDAAKLVYLQYTTFVSLSEALISGTGTSSSEFTHQ